mmetsp:Transcript_8289/g.26312  ORF Transcript_8289/g.26312 Transcript_8289/m.26312 type:complete len:579 (-) Transcript_8289:252-1988(-)
MCTHLSPFVLRSQRRLRPGLRVHLQGGGVPLAPGVLCTPIEVHGAHGSSVDASERQDSRRSVQLCARQPIVRGGELELEAAEQVEHDQTHLHLGEVPAQAVARRMRERREALRLRVRSGHGAPDARDLLRHECPLRVEAVDVGAPELRVAVPRPIGNLHGGAARQEDPLAARAGHRVVELEPPEGAVWHGGPHPQRLRDAAVHEGEPGQLAIGGIAAGQGREEGVNLLLQLPLQLGVPRELKEQPGHGVARGIVPCEEDQQHVPKVCRAWQLRGPHRARERAVHGPAVAGECEGRLAGGPRHDLLHRRRERADLGATRLALEGRADGLVRSLHEGLGAAQQRQLKLRLGLVQQEVVHVDGLAVGHEPRQALGAALRALQGLGQDLRQGGEGQEGLGQVPALLLPVLIVRGGDEAVVKDGAEVALLPCVRAGEPLGVIWVPHEHARAEPPLHAGAGPVESELGDDDVAAQAAVAVPLHVAHVEEHGVALGFRHCQLVHEGHPVLLRLRIHPRTREKVHGREALGNHAPAEDLGELLLDRHISLVARRDTRIEERQQRPRTIGHQAVAAPLDLLQEQLAL